MPNSGRLLNKDYLHCKSCLVDQTEARFPVDDAQESISDTSSLYSQLPLLLNLKIYHQMYMLECCGIKNFC